MFNLRTNIMVKKYQILTRKQIWRRCKNTKVNNITIEGVPTLKPVEKKIRFKNIVQVTLIPTKEELESLHRYYNSYEEFV